MIPWKLAFRTRAHVPGSKSISAVFKLPTCDIIPGLCESKACQTVSRLLDWAASVFAIRILGRVLRIGVTAPILKCPSSTQPQLPGDLAGQVKDLEGKRLRRGTCLKF